MLPEGYGTFLYLRHVGLTGDRRLPPRFSSSRHVSTFMCSFEKSQIVYQLDHIKLRGVGFNRTPPRSAEADMSDSHVIDINNPSNTVADRRVSCIELSKELGNGLRQQHNHSPPLLPSVFGNPRN